MSDKGLYDRLHISIGLKDAARYMEQTERNILRLANTGYLPIIKGAELLPDTVPDSNEEISAIVEKVFIPLTELPAADAKRWLLDNIIKKDYVDIDMNAFREEYGQIETDRFSATLEAAQCLYQTTGNSEKAKAIMEYFTIFSDAPTESYYQGPRQPLEIDVRLLDKYLELREKNDEGWNS